MYSIYDRWIGHASTTGGQIIVKLGLGNTDNRPRGMSLRFAERDSLFTLHTTYVIGKIYILNKIEFEVI